LIDREGLAEMVYRDRHLYHLVWDATPEKIASVQEHGLERVRSNYTGYWESRSDHVYLGRLSHIERIFFKGVPSGQAFVNDAGLANWSIFAVDLAALEPQRVNPNEDHFAFYSANGQEVSRRFGLPFSPCKWAWDWARYLGIRPPASLGEWAEAINLGRDPDTTRYSAAQGSIAYRGVVPPNALRLIRTNLLLDDDHSPL